MSDTLRVGDNVFIPSPMNKYFQVQATEPFNYATGEGSETEFSSVSTGSTSGFKNIKILEPDKTPRRLFQVWPGIKDGCVYFVKIPTGTNRWGIDEDKDVGYLDNLKSPYYAKNRHYEIWLISDFYPSINASNATGASITPKVYFEGMKYDIKELLGKPAVFRALTLGGVAV